jgi:hypothetical protein
MLLSGDRSDEGFVNALRMNVNVGSRRSSNDAPSVKTSALMNKVDPEVLLKRWGIGIESAKRTVKVTTQRGVRTVLYPPLWRRIRTSD